MDRSIYKTIQDAILQDGSLPDNFVIPRNENNKELLFADGALDGIKIYHVGLKEADITKLTEVLNHVSDGLLEKAMEELQEVLAEEMALDLIDGIQKWILEHKGELKTDKIYDFAVHMILDSIHCEVVKIGCGILELFDTNGDVQLKESIRKLALSDEFTLFSLFLMKSWENATEEIFEATKKVKGWGRIHAIEILEPNSEEMRQWILTEGCHNTVMPEYSAFTCMKKSKLMKKLKGDFTKEEFQGAGFIIDSLIREGQVDNISQIKHPKKLFKRYIHQAQKMADNIQDYIIILHLLEYLRAHISEKYEEIIKEAEELLSGDKCKRIAMEALEHGDGCEIAKYLGIDYVEKAFSNVTGDFYGKYELIQYLLPEGHKVDEIITLFEDKLDLGKIATGAADQSGIGEEYKEHFILLFILQYLTYTKGKGINLVMAGLQSPVVPVRGMALSVLEYWVGREWVDRSNNILFILLPTLLQKEVNDELRGRMNNLIEMNEKHSYE